ncbi:MAG: tRNA threonylcarbamoyladenosine dehydratase [Lachnospiraceae bacterium]|jgi:tRNA A37 threonylcarbamoyladenosine dehydratase|nr:tRNA threonylcarbamoyladenosine dehydratase [Lachnospiraceae bacterium]
MDQYNRTTILIGQDNMEKLHNSRVAVFGVGGVGGFVIEALVRSGVGNIDIIDNDQVALTNLNRQIIATRSTVGKNKVDVMEERILDINPECNVKKYTTFFLPENSDAFDFDKYNYVVDAIDTVTGKIELIMKANSENVPIISAMGAGNKLDASRFKVADIYKTTMDPLAKVMRRELKKRGIKKLKVVFSDEKPIVPDFTDEPSNKRVVPGSTAFCPAVSGLIIAGEVVKDLIE